MNNSSSWLVGSKRRAPLAGYPSQQSSSFPIPKEACHIKRPMRIIYLCTFFLFFQFTCSRQFYDPNPCLSTKISPGYRYICDDSLSSCHSFIVYRSQQGFETVSEICGLLGVDQDKVLALNHLTNPSQILDENREVLVPIQCSCSGGFFQSNASYKAPAGVTYNMISCVTFEGLVKSPTLVEENPGEAKLTLPLRCACPDIDDTRNGFQYLVTYPIVEFDTTMLVAKKFGISPSDIWEQNSQDPFPTIYPNTTILVPVRAIPMINSSITDPQNEDPGFVPLSPTWVSETSGGQKHLYVIGSGIGVFSVIVLLGLGFYCKGSYKKGDKRLQSVSTQSSMVSCLSPDVVAEMSKYSLISYGVVELSEATKGFSEDTKLGSSVHKGNFGGTQLVIKKMGFGDARRIISIHSKINHTSIVKLEGVCYGDDEFSPSYLVFEFALNGCLRDCLSSSLEVALPWRQRTRIAFDVAIGLHYIHHCTVPSYIHMNINSRNILITEEWRAKIANLGVGSIINSSKERVDVVMTAEGWIAPEYLQHGLVSPKVDVFAFGVVLLELISAKEASDGSFLTNNLGFLIGEGSGSGCFDELREFVDPRLEHFPLSETLCMTVLAKACVEDEPLQRPSMDDILKILARMER